MGHKPATEALIVVDTSAAEVQEFNDVEKEVDDADPAEVVSPLSVSTSTSVPSNSTPGPSTPTPGLSAVTPTSRQSTQKRTCSVKKDTNVVDLIKQMLERQTESDIKMMELEEK